MPYASNSPSWKLLAAFFLLNFVPNAFSSQLSPSEFTPANMRRRSGSPERPVVWGPPVKRDGGVPLVIVNNCAETLWPGIGTQGGTGPGTGGFQLASGDRRNLTVGNDWQGRVWGRTNCSFNALGTGASNLNGNNGAGRACITGDCGGVLSCVLTGETPVTLVEWDLMGGSDGKQTFYDVSLVDGYNLPVGLVYIPGDDPDLQEIPPNLTNAACIATAGLLLDPSVSGTSGNASNSSFPIPYEQDQTSAKVAGWCPWDLQVTPPTKPGDGVYPYPDDNIQRPIFDPCLSACAKTNSPSDCCTGKYDNPKVCKPGLYSSHAKAVCPDAYSYAFDDQTSTFIIPAGGGWEVTFCPAGRSTNILKTFGPQLSALGQSGKMTESIKDAAMNLTIIQEGGKENAAGGHTTGDPRLGTGSLGALVMVVAWAILW